MSSATFVRGLGGPASARRSSGCGSEYRPAASGGADRRSAPRPGRAGSVTIRRRIECLCRRRRDHDRRRQRPNRRRGHDGAPARPPRGADPAARAASCARGEPRCAAQALDRGAGQIVGVAMLRGDGGLDRRARYSARQRPARPPASQAAPERSWRPSFSRGAAGCRRVSAGMLAVSAGLSADFSTGFSGFTDFSSGLFGG